MIDAFPEVAGYAATMKTSPTDLPLIAHVDLAAAGSSVTVRE